MKSLRLKPILILLLLSVSFSATAEEAVSNELASRDNRFGFKLFQQLTKSEPAKNVFISPQSIATALAMLYNGAGGETQQAMAKTLEIQGLSLADVNQAHAQLKKQLNTADSQTQLQIANSIWAAKGYSFEDDFLAVNKKFYDATLEVLDLQNPDAVKKINGWVAKHTQNKIPKIIDQVKPTDVMFLINAIYFKGTWTTAFDPAQSKPHSFRKSDGSSVELPFMHRAGTFDYHVTSNFQFLSLPYGNERFRMIIVLPTKAAGMASLIKQLEAKTWRNWLDQVRPMQGRIALPRFQVEYGIELKDSLSALGMGIVFDESRADLSKLLAFPPGSPMRPFVSSVRHKSFVEVNEEGTEAAAATSVAIGVTAVAPGPTFEMIVDRPFLTAIIDSQSSAVLFLGAINDLAADQK